jgi:hypothetical protein
MGFSRTLFFGSYPDAHRVRYADYSLFLRGIANPCVNPFFGVRCTSIWEKTFSDDFKK